MTQMLIDVAIVISVNIVAIAAFAAVFANVKE